MRNLPILSSITALSLLCLTSACNNDPAKDSISESSDTSAAAASQTDAKFDAKSMASILAADIRLGDKDRDTWRNPAQTLEFFGVAPSDHIIEYAPGGGWYTRILAPYVNDKGSYIGVGFPPEAGISISEAFVERVRQGGDAFSETQSQSLGIAKDKIPFYFSNQIPSELDGTIDKVLIFRMMHNLKRWGIDSSEIAALKATLKPNGMIGIVQHRAKDDAPADYVDGNMGYLKRADLITFMDKQGFELAAESDVNENPKDTTDYLDGVWTLPPSLGSDDKDKSKFKAIGESNRMTLLFKQKAL